MTPSPPRASDPPTSRRWLLLWAFSGALAFICGMYLIAHSLADGEFVPGDHDSFYHASRILDALAHWPHLMQFDPRIHAPEGSWLTWPWGFDFGLALMVKALQLFWPGLEPISILVFVAPCWAFVNAGLLLAICKRLQLGILPATAVMFAYATSTLTLSLHHVGMLDHHFVELSFVLLGLHAGLGWMEAPDSPRRAGWLGFWLGLAPAFHNGDFILQLPVLATLALRWWQGAGLPPRAALAFAVSLMVTSLLVLLPSEPFRQWMYSYTLHSWFHLHVAACSALAAVSLAGPRSSRRLLALAGCGLLGLPLLGQVSRGGEWLFGELEQLGAMTEVLGVLDYLRAGQFARLFELYSLLICVLPLGLGWVVWRALRAPDAPRVFLAVYSVFGSALLVLQFRLEYFGSFALWLLPALFVEEHWRTAAPQAARRARLALVMLVPLAMLPGRRVLLQPQPLAGDFMYRPLRPLFAQLHARCADKPGVVLASNTVGHYITYHSACAVIANNFILTPQHEEKLRLANALLGSSLADALKKAPYVRYLLVTRADPFIVSTCFPNCPDNAGLRHELLERKPDAPQLRLLGEVTLMSGKEPQPLARLFEVLP